MSLLSTLILPEIEKIVATEAPEVGQWVLAQIQTLGDELIAYVESKANGAATNVTGATGVSGATGA